MPSICINNIDGEQCDEQSVCEHIKYCHDCMYQSDEEHRINQRFWYSNCMRCVFEGKKKIQWQYDTTEEKEEYHDILQEIGQLDAKEKCAYTYKQIIKAMKSDSKYWKESLWVIEAYIGGVHIYYSENDTDEDIKDMIRRGEYNLYIFVDGKKYSLTVEQ